MLIMSNPKDANVFCGQQLGLSSLQFVKFVPNDIFTSTFLCVLSLLAMWSSQSCYKGTRFRVASKAYFIVLTRVRLGCKGLSPIGSVGRVQVHCSLLSSIHVQPTFSFRMTYFHNVLILFTLNSSWPYLWRTLPVDRRNTNLVLTLVYFEITMNWPLESRVQVQENDSNNQKSVVKSLLSCRIVINSVRKCIRPDVAAKRRRPVITRSS